MPYIASNGELYEDEEIFKIDYDEIEEDEEEFNYLPPDEITIWERRFEM
jgi:hypothetical protein